MNGWYILALITGILLDIACILPYLFPSRKKTLWFRLFFDAINLMNVFFIFFYTENTLLLAAITTGVVAIIRDVIFYYRNRYPKMDSWLWPTIISIIYIASVNISYTNWLSLFPVIGSVINTFALYCNNQKHTKMITLVGQIFFITYNSCLINASNNLTIMNLISSSFMFVSALIGLIYILYMAKKNDEMGKKLGQ